jgi:DMSO/TMAO reductase YedYZ molybdopterin-dependent catalytic subunit
MIENVSRRDLLKLGAAGALSLAAPRAAFAQVAGPILKPLPPEWFVNFGTNAEMRWDAARDQGYLIDPQRFFVRNHTRTPTIDPATWRLKVSGNGVRKPLELSYRQLEKLACDSETAFIECAGNGRSFFGTQQGSPASGTQWKLGAIGVARWRGVRLREVLEHVIKWLGSIEVADTALSTPFNTTFYPGLTRQNVKSAFELAWDGQVTAGARQVLHGRSWSGHAPIRKVEVSTDGGASWRRARLHGPNLRNAWVRWKLPWTPTPGRHELLARATDRTGLTQPDTVEFNPPGYGFWAVVRHPVTAR